MAFASFSPMFRPMRRAFIAAILFPRCSAAMAASGSVAVSLAFRLSVRIGLNSWRKFRAVGENGKNADVTASGAGTDGLDRALIPGADSICGPRVHAAARRLRTHPHAPARARVLLYSSCV